MKLFNIFLTAALSVFSTQAIAQNECTVNGRLKNVEDGAEILLMQEMGRVGMSIASDTVRDGRFSIKWPAGDGTEKFSLYSSSDGFPGMSLNIWAKAGSVIEVSGNDKYIYTWGVKNDVPEQAEWARLLNPNRENWIEYQRLSAERKDLFRKMDGLANNERGKIRAAIDSVDKLSDLIMQVIYKKEMELLEKGKMTDIGMERLQRIALHVNYPGGDSMRPQAEVLYNKLSDGQKKSIEGKTIYINLYPPKVVQTGNSMADGNLNDLDGKGYNLSDFNGKFILLDFWSMGCGPCIMAMPEMRELAEKYETRLAIVSLTCDNDKAWRTASASYDITWYNLSDGMEFSGIAAQYGVNAIPHYTLISPEGIIIDSWTGYGKNNLKNRMKKYIK